MLPAAPEAPIEYRIRDPAVMKEVLDEIRVTMVEGIAADVQAWDAATAQPH